MFAGELHYFRVPREFWKPCMRAMKQLGFAAVDTPVPWSLHERQRGTIRWDDYLDLPGFLDAAAELGLAVILRPGPHIGRKVPGLGFPGWVLDDPDMLARTARGTSALWPFPPLMTPLPSYAAKQFQEAVGQWFAEVAAAVGDRPLGRVVLDHELGLFHRRGAADLDHHPDALGWWAEFAGENETIGGARWVAFLEDYQRRAADWLRAASETSGLGGDGGGRGGGGEIASGGQGGGGGLGGGLASGGQGGGGGLGGGLASGKQGGGPLVSAPLALGGRPLANAAPSAYGRPGSHPDIKSRLSSQAPAAEWVSITGGGSPTRMRRTPGDDLSQLAATVAGGARGISVHMAVERDRWYGAWIDADGSITDHGQKMGQVMGRIAEHGFTDLRERRAIAIVQSRADRRHGISTAALAELPPLLAELVGISSADLGADNGAQVVQRWYSDLAEAVRLAQIPAGWVDETCESIGDARAVVVPTHERVDSDLWARLKTWDVPVILGPGKPARDAWDQPLADPGLPSKCGLMQTETSVEALADDLLSVAGELGDDYIAAEQKDIECTAMRDENGEVRVLVVSNHGRRETTAEVTISSAFRDPYSGAALTPSAGGAATLSLKERQVRLFVRDD